MPPLPQLTIVIPTYNEAENLSKLIPVLISLNIPGLKVIVVDDNSPDGTGKIADNLAAQYPGSVEVIHRSGKQGFGKALLCGFQRALQQGAEAIGQMDADFSHPPEKLFPMLEHLQNYDMVLGSRYIRGGKLDEQWPLWRKALSAFGNLYARTILQLPVKDATGGYRVWRHQALAVIPLERIRSNGYAFQVEMIYVAHRCGFSFDEVPIYFAERSWGQSKMSFKIQVEAALRVWQMLFDYRDLHPTLANS